MSITINGIACEEIVEGHSESINIMSGPSARKGFLCNWTDRYTVAKGLLGLSTAVSVGGAITLNYPAVYPEINTAYCHTIELQPKGSPTQGTKQLTWPKCIVWANYGRLPFFANSLTQIDPTNPQVFATQKLASSCEWYTIPQRGAHFKMSTKPINRDAGIRLSLVEIEITFKNMPYMPSPTAFGKSGLINNATFFGVTIGKLLFNGLTTELTANYDGSYSLDATYSLTARSQRWDYGFDPLFNRWDQIVWPDNTTPFITTTDFTQILPVYTLVV